MSSINNVGGNNPVQKIYTKPVAKPAETQSAQPTHSTRATDRLELSGAGHLLKALKAGGDIRADKVAAVRAQLEAGTYETEAKLDAAIDRLMDDLGR
jgi:negative regulator of flagellin synthesis FlgM